MTETRGQTEGLRRRWRPRCFVPPLRILVGLPVFSMMATSGIAEPDTADLANWWSPCHNCYNYATNKKDDGAGTGIYIPNPGNKSFFTHGAWTEASVRTCAGPAPAGDGLTNIGPVPWVPGSPVPDCPEGSCLVAFAITHAQPGIPAGRDYHFYRLNEDGKWSHKPGSRCGRILKNADGTDATNPEDADRGIYGTFGGYMCVPANPMPTLTSRGAWRRAGSNVRCFSISEAGDFSLGQARTITDIGGLFERLPTLTPIPDPEWDDFGDTGLGGFGVLPDEDGAGLPVYMQVFDGKVAYFSDLDDPLTITYYLDDNGLTEFLEQQGHAIPAVSEWGVMIMTLLALTAGTIVFCRRRSFVVPRS